MQLQLHTSDWFMLNFIITRIIAIWYYTSHVRMYTLQYRNIQDPQLHETSTRNLKLSPNIIMKNKEHAFTYKWLHHHSHEKLITAGKHLYIHKKTDMLSKWYKIHNSAVKIQCDQNHCIIEKIELLTRVSNWLLSASSSRKESLV